MGVHVRVRLRRPRPHQPRGVREAARERPSGRRPRAPAERHGAGACPARGCGRASCAGRTSGRARTEGPQAPDVSSGAVHFGAHQDLELLALLVSLGALLVLAPTLRMPLPILLVLGGVVMGFIPGLPQVSLPPDVVLVGVLPPLLYSGAFFTSLRELRKNKRAVSFLAFGLVGATMAVVAVVSHEWIGLSWPVAFTLGAVVSPTDALAATEIMSRIGAPRRIVSLIEGESLVNDGTALVLYKAAVGAAVGGTFSLLDTSGRIVLNVVGGIAVGLAVGWVVRQVRKRLDDPPVEVALAVLSGYLAYLPAVAIGVSGVLAAVTIGVYMGWHTPELTNERTRLVGDSFWNIFVFLINALLFVLVGLQLRGIVDALTGISTAKLIGYSSLVAAAVIVTRIVCVPMFAYLPRLLFPRIRAADPYPPWQWPAVISWAGMRGAVSLVAALALPTDFPDRQLIVVLTFAVIVATLVIQGLTLPSVINVLGVHDDGAADREDAKARIKAAEAALARLEELVAEGAVREDTAERLRGALSFRANRFRARFDEDDDGAIEERSVAYQRVMRELIAAEQSALVHLRNERVIDDNVMQRVQHDLDLEAARLDADR
ncbi:MAG: Na+/H+ antiporter [Actinobacteria bacterium]|nr:MAG: Na+/H+ antiporter [Actinomycetota bacterium]